MMIINEFEFEMIGRIVIMNKFLTWSAVDIDI